MINVLSISVALISATTTFILAMITFMQIYASTRAKLAFYSKFITLTNDYYLVLKNIGHTDCKIISVDYDYTTKSLFKSNEGLLTDNCKKYSILPFEGFNGSSFCCGEQQLCKVNLYTLFENKQITDLKLLSFKVSIKYSFRFLFHEKIVTDEFNVPITEYLSTADRLANSIEYKKDTIKDLSSSVNFLSKCLQELHKNNF